MPERYVPVCELCGQPINTMTPYNCTKPGCPQRQQANDTDDYEDEDYD